MLVFDVESIPTVGALEAPYPEAERQPPGTYKLEAAIAKWRESDREKWSRERIKECSLSPLLGRVVAISYHTQDTTWCVLAQTPEQEAPTLVDFWARVDQAGLIGGFNSMAFDLPFLITRSLILGVEVPFGAAAQYRKRYSYAPHFDARMALANWDSFAKGTLEDWLTALDLPMKSGSGGDVWEMVQRGAWEELGAYGCRDVESEAQLIARIAGAFGVTL